MDWSVQAEPVQVRAQTAGDTDVPSLTILTINNDNHVTKGDWLEFTIGDDGDARQMDIRIRNERGDELEFRQQWAPGTYIIPTALTFGAMLLLFRIIAKRGGLDGLTPAKIETYVRYANRAASITASRPGAIPAMPTENELTEE